MSNLEKNKIYFVANWKMGLNYFESVQLLQKLRIQFPRKDNVQFIICPSFTALLDFKKLLHNSSIEYGAQNCFWEEHGAYTGEISPKDLALLGCKYVILGHSERRKFLGETNEMIHKKARVVYENGMTPILCIGENWDQRSEGKKDFTLIQQLTESLEGITLDANKKLFIAYEPAWAVSTAEGIEPEPDEVSYANDVIRQVVLDLSSKEFVENNICILYGGSVKAENAHSFLDLPTVQGLLVGSAAQKEETFRSLIETLI